MFSSDEEIPYVEPVTRYKFKKSRICGERLIVQRIQMESNYVSTFKIMKKGNIGVNHEMTESLTKHDTSISADVSERVRSPEKRLSMRKSGERLNDQSITDLLCDSGSSVDSENDSEIYSCVSQKSSKLQTSEAREKWITSLRKEDLSSLRRSTKCKTNLRGGRVQQNVLVDDDSEKRKVTPKKNTSRIEDEKRTLNDSVEGTRRSQRKCKTKYSAAEWNIGCPFKRHGKRVNVMSSVDEIECNERQSSSDDSLDSQPLNRRYSVFLSKRKPNSISAEREIKKTIQIPRKRTTSTSNNAKKLCEDSSLSDSSDYEILPTRKSDSRSKNKSKSVVVEHRIKETIQTPRKRVTSSINAQRKCKTKYSAAEWNIGCPFKRHGKRVNVMSSVDEIESNERQSSSDDSVDSEPLNRRYADKSKHLTSSEGSSTPIKNVKVTSVVDSPKGSSRSVTKTPVNEKYVSGTKVNRSIIKEDMGDNIKKRDTTRPESPNVIQNTKNQNQCTPNRKLTGHQRNPEHNLTPTTPSSRKTGFKRLLCTPSMPVCKRDFGTPHTPLQEAMTKLHVSAVPQSLPCREAEFANIHRFLEGKILDGAGGCIYISGVPGTGKTATVREVVRSLKQDVQNDDIPDFQFIELNGMRLSHPRQAYVQLWKVLANETVTAEQAQRLLENKFTKSSKNKMSIVLLVDEVDVLWTKRQDVVYNLLDWPAKAKSHLIVVTIANTMDLPERLLMGRVTSRLGLTRLTFQPYTHRQLEEIVKARLRGINAFDPDAIQFVSRKVASVSGDARRALDICRRATEIAEQESSDALVTIKHVDEAMTAMTSSHSVQAIVHACSTIEKLFLQAVDAELTRTGLEETTFCKVFRMMETLCSLEGLQLPSVSLIMGACMKLSSMRLLLSQHSNMDIYTRIFLNVSSDDLHYALKRAKKEL